MKSNLNKLNIETKTGLHKRPTYDEMINYVEKGGPKIKYPNRRASLLRNGFAMSQFDGEESRQLEIRNMIESQSKLREYYLQQIANHYNINIHNVRNTANQMRITPIHRSVAEDIFRTPYSPPRPPSPDGGGLGGVLDLDTSESDQTEISRATTPIEAFVNMARSVSGGAERTGEVLGAVSGGATALGIGAGLTGFGAAILPAAQIVAGSTAVLATGAKIVGGVTGALATGVEFVGNTASRLASLGQREEEPREQRQAPMIYSIASSDDPITSTDESDVQLRLPFGEVPVSDLVLFRHLHPPEHIESLEEFHHQRTSGERQTDLLEYMQQRHHEQQEKQRRQQIHNLMHGAFDDNVEDPWIRRAIQNQESPHLQLLPVAPGQSQLFYKSGGTSMPLVQPQRQQPLALTDRLPEQQREQPLEDQPHPEATSSSAAAAAAATTQENIYKPILTTLQEVFGLDPTQTFSQANYALQSDARKVGSKTAEYVFYKYVITLLNELKQMAKKKIPTFNKKTTIQEALQAIGPEGEKVLIENAAELEGDRIGQSKFYIKPVKRLYTKTSVPSHRGKGFKS